MRGGRKAVLSAVTVEGKTQVQTLYRDPQKAMPCKTLRKLQERSLAHSRLPIQTPYCACPKGFTLQSRPCILERLSSTGQSNSCCAFGAVLSVVILSSKMTFRALPQTAPGHLHLSTGIRQAKLGNCVNSPGCNVCRQASLAHAVIQAVLSVVILSHNHHQSTAPYTALHHDICACQQV